MFHVLWEFHVRPGAEEAFESVYGSEGDWVRLFRRDAGYVETILLRHQDRPGRYVVMDIWRTAAAYHGFKAAFREEYAALDRECQALRQEERCLGEFAVP